MNMENVMFVVAHKSLKNRVGVDGYCYLGVSRKASDMDFYDDTLDNISIKNPYYCELTALYWIWKNVDCENVGLCHYRRFFVDLKNEKIEVAKIRELDKILNKYDLIVPKVSKLRTTVKKHYEMNVKNNGLDIVCKMIIEEDSSFIPHVKRILNSKECFYCNMFYAKKEIINEYCKWLFNLLTKLEPYINMNGWSQYEQRFYGFLAEILFNIWVSHEKLDVFYHDFYKTESFPQFIDNKLDYSVKYNRKTKIRILLWPFVKKIGNFRKIEV